MKQKKKQGGFLQRENNVHIVTVTPPFRLRMPYCIEFCVDTSNTFIVGMNSKKCLLPFISECNVIEKVGVAFN